VREKTVGAVWQRYRFHNAQRVWAWLGEGRDGVEEVVSFILLFHKIAEEHQSKADPPMPVFEGRLPATGSPFWHMVQTIVCNSCNNGIEVTGGRRIGLAAIRLSGGTDTSKYSFCLRGAEATPVLAFWVHVRERGERFSDDWRAIELIQ
jgi:hypothetical protein